MVFSSNQVLSVSPNLQIAIYLKDLVELTSLLFNDVEEHEFPSDCTQSYLKLEERFSLQSVEFYSCIQFEIRKKIGLLILLNCEAASLTVFTTMCPQEQRTSDILIVRDYYFIIEIFDKCSFSSILRGCLSHLNEAWKE